MKTLAAPKARNIKTSAAPKARNIKTSAAPKARNIKTSAAPKARNMKARGKREAQRNASPLVNENKLERSTESAKYHSSYFALSELHDHYALYQGRRASRCSALAPGFHIPRLWRWTMFGACPFALIFRAFGAGLCSALALALIFRAFGAGLCSALALAFIFRA